MQRTAVLTRCLDGPQSAGQCFESVLGIAQVFFQWACFNTMYVPFHWLLTV
jgi:hypothetical protein